MAVSINIGRGGVEIKWETGDYEGPVRIKAQNVENGDVGVVKDTNDGKHFLTWPPGTYIDEVTVYTDDEAATVIDQGTIAVTVSE
jgi:hypothetical protein